LHELKIIISAIIIERKRAEILRHQDETVEDFKAGKLKSYKNAEEVRAALNALFEESKGEENFSYQPALSDNPLVNLFGANKNEEDGLEFQKKVRK